MEKTKPNRTAAAPEQHRRDLERASEAGGELAQHSMSVRQARACVWAFKLQLLPLLGRGGGRRNTERITKAYQDWLAGLRGVELFKRHIPRFERLGYYERKVKQQGLMSSINSRHRKETQAALDMAEAQVENAQLKS